jgi:hypothetical protein
MPPRSGAAGVRPRRTRHTFAAMAHRRRTTPPTRWVSNARIASSGVGNCPAIPTSPPAAEPVIRPTGLMPPSGPPVGLISQPSGPPDRTQLPHTAADRPAGRAGHRGRVRSAADQAAGAGGPGRDGPPARSGPAITGAGLTLSIHFHPRFIRVHRADRRLRSRGPRQMPTSGDWLAVPERAELNGTCSSSSFADPRFRPAWRPSDRHQLRTRRRPSPGGGIAV